MIQETVNNLLLKAHSSGCLPHLKDFKRAYIHSFIQIDSIYLPKI